MRQQQAFQSIQTNPQHRQALQAGARMAGTHHQAASKSQKRKRQIKCEYCPSIFISNNNLRRHLYEIHKDVVNNLPEPPKIECDEYLRCRRCDIKFDTKAEWIEHKVGEARVMKPFCPFQWGCDLCGIYVSRKEKLINHINNHMKESVIIPVEQQQPKPQAVRNTVTVKPEIVAEIKPIVIPVQQQQPPVVKHEVIPAAVEADDFDEDDYPEAEVEVEAEEATENKKFIYEDDDEEADVEEEFEEDEDDEARNVNINEEEEDDSQDVPNGGGENDNEEEEYEEDGIEMLDEDEEEEIDENTNDGVTAARKSTNHKSSAETTEAEDSPSYAGGSDDEDDLIEEDDGDTNSSSDHDPKPPAPKLRFACELCQDRFDSQQELQKHVKMHFLNGPGSISLTGIKSKTSQKSSRSSSSDVVQ